MEKEKCGTIFGNEEFLRRLMCLHGNYVEMHFSQNM
jgi:hypothetical protein